MKKTFVIAHITKSLTIEIPLSIVEKCATPSFGEETPDCIDEVHFPTVEMLRRYLSRVGNSIPEFKGDEDTTAEQMQTNWIQWRVLWLLSKDIQDDNARVEKLIADCDGENGIASHPDGAPIASHKFKRMEREVSEDGKIKPIAFSDSEEEEKVIEKEKPAKSTPLFRDLPARPAKILEIKDLTAHPKIVKPAAKPTSITKAEKVIKPKVEKTIAATKAKKEYIGPVRPSLADLDLDSLKMD